MKNFISRCSLLCLIFTLFSCNSDEITPEPEIITEVTDTYNYIAFRNDGQLFEIGNNSGKITAVNKIPGIEFVATMNTVTWSSTKLYIYEHKFPPLQSTLITYNFSTRSSQTKAIDFSRDYFGEYPGIISLEWDEENEVLLGIVKEHYESGPNHISRLVTIDPVTFEISPMDLEIEKAYIISTKIVGDQLYLSTINSSGAGGTNDFIQLDFTTGLVTSHNLTGMVRPPIHLSNSANLNAVFGFLPIPNSNIAGAARPVLINRNTMETTNLYQDEIISNINFMGRSFFNSETGEHVDLVTSLTQYSLFQYNVNSNNVSLTSMPYPNELSSLAGIVGVKKLN